MSLTIDEDEKGPLAALPLKVKHSVIAGLKQYGKQGTVGAAIVTKFLPLRKFEETLPVNGIILSLDHAHVYPTKINEDLFHITIKKGDQTMVIELDRAGIVHLALGIIGLVNQV